MDGWMNRWMDGWMVPIAKFENLVLWLRVAKLLRLLKKKVPPCMAIN
jgi:hypothetical protein